MTLSIEPTPSLRRRSVRLLKALEETYPDANCELNFSNRLELIVATILSAQCTDQRVNQVTPDLFKKYRTAEDWSNARPATLENEIRTTGFFRNKAKNIRALGAALVRDHNGQVPASMEELLQLPGVGRKTANVALISGFGKPGIAVDTHCMRVSRRLGLTRSKNPDQIEFDLKAQLPKTRWSRWSHCVIFHGRRCCHARNPNCAGCRLKRSCPSYPINDE